MLRQRVGTLLFSLQKTIEGERAVEIFYKVSSVAMWEMDWKAYLEEKGRFRDLISMCKLKLQVQQRNDVFKYRTLPSKLKNLFPLILQTVSS